MPVFDALVPDARCRVETEGSRRVFYETDYPQRTIRVDVGSGNRAFVPSIVQIASRQMIGPEQEERETVSAQFSAEGNVEIGERKYVSTGTGGVREIQRLFPADTSAIKQLALLVLERCNK